MSRVVEFRPGLLSPHARCYLLGRLRLHHGPVGCVILAAGLALHRPPLIAMGALLALDDRDDARAWFSGREPFRF